MQVKAGNNPNKADSPIIEPPTNFDDYFFLSIIKKRIPLLKSTNKILSPDNFYYLISISQSLGIL